MTPSGIEPATFRFVAQRLNHCATAVPENNSVLRKNYICLQFTSPSQSFPQKPTFGNVRKKAIVHISHVRKVKLQTKLLTSAGVFISRATANLLTRPTYCYFTFHKYYLNSLLLNSYFVLTFRHRASSI